MLVARSFKYTSPPMADRQNEKAARRSTSRRYTPKTAERRSSTTNPSPLRSSTEPVTIPLPKPTNAPPPERSVADSTQTMSNPRSRSAAATTGRRKHSAHDANALPPAVAALLAVTAIPPRKPNRYLRRPGSERRISIEEVVKDWKSDGSLHSSYGVSPALNILLEDTDESEYDSAHGKESASAPSYLNQRSASSDSMPSLESDDRSILSLGSPSTPASLRSRPSNQNLKREKSRSLLVIQDCIQDHPLVPLPESEDVDFLLPVEKKPVPGAKGRSSFKSNLTLSLQSLKMAAVNSISSFGRAANTQSMLNRNAAFPIDDTLWSHPFLFPHLSSESRPLTNNTLSEAERRYLNPMPLTFEEQEAPFQQALHAPYLAEMVEDAPTIQMQTYNRGRRRSGVKRSSPNPSSEAGRALLGSEGVRQREVRENPDFLRVVVLEMNMRREGKLEQGRAKIWLPPREVSPSALSRSHVDRTPKRWVGVSAY